MPPSIATPLSSGTTGHAEDPPGLTWGRARCYAPRTGGWTGEDPVFTEPRYAYVGGRPSWGVDPTGRVVAGEHGIWSTHWVIVIDGIGLATEGGLVSTFITYDAPLIISALADAGFKASAVPLVVFIGSA